MCVLHWDRKALSVSFENMHFFKIKKKGIITKEAKLQRVPDWVVLPVFK